MKFEEAYLSLVENKKIRRKGWMASLYLMMSEGGAIKSYRQECIHYQYDLSIINSTGWLIVGDTENKSYLFNEMCEKLRKGQKARLPEWSVDASIETQDGQTIFMRINCEFEFVPTFGCFSANDWEIVQDQQ